MTLIYITAALIIVALAADADAREHEAAIAADNAAHKAAHKAAHGRMWLGYGAANDGCAEYAWGEAA